MKENLKLLQKIYFKYNRIIVSFSVIIFILSAIFAYKALMTPLKIEKLEQNNKIEQINTFGYRASVIPCLLYPTGGIVSPNSSVFTTVSDKLFFDVETVLDAKEPITIEGKKAVILKLVSENLWEKEYVLQPEINVNFSGRNNKIFSETYSIEINEITSFIQQVQEEIKTTSTYLMKIKPTFKGEVTYDNNKKSVNIDNELVFEYVGNHLRLYPEQQLEFNDTYTFEKKIIIPQSFTIFNREYDIIKSRIIFSIISLVFLVIVLSILISNANIKKSNTSEYILIEKKYRNRLIAIKDGIQMFSNRKLYLESFKELLKIADEKDLPIFKQKNEELVIYYIVDQNYIYLYEIEITKNYKYDIRSLGSETNNAL